MSFAEEGYYNDRVRNHLSCMEWSCCLWGKDSLVGRSSGGGGLRRLRQGRRSRVVFLFSLSSFVSSCSSVSSHPVSVVVSLRCLWLWLGCQLLMLLTMSSRNEEVFLSPPFLLLLFVSNNHQERKERERERNLSTRLDSKRKTRVSGIQDKMMLCLHSFFASSLIHAVLSF